MRSNKSGRAERLKSQKVIERLFRERQSVAAYPIRAIYTISNPPLSPSPTQTGVSVSKKKFPKAVTRNRIKRLLREAYRLQKSAFYESLQTADKNDVGQQVAIMFLFTGKEEPSYEEVEKAMKKLLKKLIWRICKK